MNRKHVFIIHGLFDCTNSWKPIGKDLSNDFQVHLLPLRNHRDGIFASTMSFEEMAIDVKNYADSHNITKFSIVGHSLGGKTAMHFAKMFPQYVEKLISIDITPFPQKSLQEYNPVVNNLLNQLVTIKNFDISKYSNLSKFVTDIKQFDKETQLVIVGNINYLEKNFTWCINVDSIFDSFDNLLDGFYADDFVENKIAVPTLFIKAKDSDFFPRSDYKATNFIFPNLQIVEIDGVTHRLHLEQPSVLSAAILKFLKN